ncbi:MAG: hypothetical protein COW30_12570 [Rhodospirillales bacterium CG15_BIG_FIL_POST_REV_8_21_14_020_66_15]|nr:MAG: hypothetical protein COW30_12570 [Rhodospirillales bacterium CG15_BIG_FIL_POST_REV_8_21_14_020_66_15]
MIRVRTLPALLVAVVTLAGCLQLTEARRVTEPPKRPPADPLDAYTFRIDKARESGAWTEGEEWIARIPPALIDDYRRWFEPRAHRFPPLWIYASARRLQEDGAYVKAAYWYVAARERQIRQLRRCRDDSAKEQLIWADAGFADLRAEMGRHPELTRYAAKHAFAWLDLHEDPEAGLLAACLRGQAGAERAKDGRLVPVDGTGGRGRAFRLVPPPVENPADWIIPESEIHDIRTWSRILMKKDVASILGEPEELPPVSTLTPLR